ncbi:MAG: hypothetical protein WDO19_22055 [Bacteroidota bacterium]
MSNKQEDHPTNEFKNSQGKPIFTLEYAYNTIKEKIQADANRSDGKEVKTKPIKAETTFHESKLENKPDSKAKVLREWFGNIINLGLAVLTFFLWREAVTATKAANIAAGEAATANELTREAINDAREQDKITADNNKKTYDLLKQSTNAQIDALNISSSQYKENKVRFTAQEKVDAQKLYITLQPLIIPFSEWEVRHAELNYQRLVDLIGFIDTVYLSFKNQGENLFLRKNLQLSDKWDKCIQHYNHNKIKSATDGGGFPAMQDAPRLFDEFYQVFREAITLCEKFNKP